MAAGRAGDILAMEGLSWPRKSGWRLADLAPALDRLLSETDAADWPGRVERLNRWR